MLKPQAAPQKIVRLASGRAIAGGAPVSGYEIHIGRTFGPDCARPLFELANGPDGAMSADGMVMGAYLHGVFGLTHSAAPFWPDLAMPRPAAVIMTACSPRWMPLQMRWNKVLILKDCLRWRVKSPPRA